MTLQLEHKAAPGSAEPPVARGALDELRAIYDAVDTGEDQTEVFDIQGTNIAVRYRRLGYEESLAALGGNGSAWENNAQFLIAACDEILYRDPDTGEAGPIKPGVRVTFDFRPGESIPLHEVLGRDETDIRRSVLRAFKGADRVLLLHAQRVDAWMDALHVQAGEKFSEG